MDLVLGYGGYDDLMEVLNEILNIMLNNEYCYFIYIYILRVFVNKLNMFILL